MKARLTKLFSLLTILTLGITNMWGADVILTPTAGEYTKGIPHKDGNLYFSRAGGKTKKVTINSKDYICPNECGFVFTLTAESEIVLSTLRASGSSTCNAIKLIDASDMLETLYAAANTNNKTLSAELITWASETGAKKAYYDELGITSSSDNNNKILTGQTANAKFPVAEDVDGNTYTKPSSLGTATTSLGTYAAGTYLLYMGFGDSSLGLEKITLKPSSTTKYTVTYKAGDGTGDDVVDDNATKVADCPSTFSYAGHVFTGWKDEDDNDVAVGATVTKDMTLIAQWANKYTVTYDKNGGTGTMADTYNEIVACTFTAPDGKAFKEWNTQADGNGTTYAVGASVADDLNLFAIWKSAPTVLFHYQWTGTGSAPAKDDVLNATGGTILVSTYGSNNLGTQSLSSYVAGTPDDMKVQATSSMKFLKFGNNDPYMELTLTSGKFKTGDTLKICGDAPFYISSSVTTATPSGDLGTLTTGGTSSNNAGVGYLVIPQVEDEDAEFNHLYLSRKSGSSAYFAAVKVIRPAARTIISTVVELTSASIGDDALSAADFATLTTGPAYTYALETKANEAPTMHFNKRTTITYDEGDPKVTNEDIAVATTDNGAGYWQAQATVNAITYTIKVAKPATYAITYYPGDNGSGSIAPGNKAEDVDFTLSSERFTRAGYLQTGWAKTDGGAQAYALGATYTANEALDLYPVWTKLDTYVAPFECATSAPAGWTFSNDGFDADNKATVASVCTFVENGLTTPKTTTGDGTSDDDVAFAKNTDAIATYDLGITTTVAALDVVLTGGSGNPFNEEIELLGADGTTVKKEYTNSLSAGNWKDNVINKTDIVEDVRYIRIHGASKWVVMKDFSVSYIETRTKYDVTFAAGTGASGSMDALHYIEGAEVVLPACTFTAPTDKEFDVWTSSDVTITDGKFTMPAKNVTVTATWKDAVTRFTVTFETNGGSSIDAQEVEENGHPTAVANPTKDNYVFVGWYNNSDLADEHAVADITALTITEDITLYAKWALDLQVTKIVFSNGFDAFIDKDAKTVKAYYMSGESAPTIESYEANANVKTTDGVLIEGSKLVLVGTDDSRKEYNFTLDAVAPMTSFDKQTFDGKETYIKGGSGFAAERGWKFQKNADDGRIPKGLTRLYVFLGGGADKATFKSYAKRAVHVYVNNVLVSSVTELPSDAEFEIPLNPSDATNMIAFISNQTGGDAGIFDVKLNEHTISSDATLGALTVNGDAVTLVDGVFEYDVELAYGTSSAPTIVATANDAGAVATVVSCTLSGATIEVVPESGESDKKTYTLTFTVSRYPKIIIWDGATMSAVATSPDASGLEWAVTGFGSIANYSVSLDGKDYVKCLPSGGNGGATRNISLTIPDGYVGRVTIVFGSHSDDERGMFIGKTATKTLDETSILTLYSPGRTSLVKGTSLWSGGTYYINPMASVDFYEITVELTPGYARTDMLGAGVLGTICVDHNVAINEAFGASFYELAGKEATYGKIVFEEIIAGELEAGKPYVFQAEGNLIALLYGSTEVSSPVNTGALKGTFTGELFTAEQAAEKDIYFFRDHALWSAKETGLQVLANRAWLEMGSVGEFSNPSPAPGRRYIMLGTNGTNVATGIDDVQDDVRSTKMLIDGRLFILRGEKIYDATGRLVK